MTQIIKLCIYKRVFATYIKQCIPIKSNIQIIQTDTPFVILRKYPRFSILQKDENTMNKTWLVSRS